MSKMNRDKWAMYLTGDSPQNLLGRTRHGSGLLLLLTPALNETLPILPNRILLAICRRRLHFALSLCATFRPALLGQPELVSALLRAGLGTRCRGRFRVRGLGRTRGFCSQGIVWQRRHRVDVWSCRDRRGTRPERRRGGSWCLADKAVR